MWIIYESKRLSSAAKRTRVAPIASIKDRANIRERLNTNATVKRRGTMSRHLLLHVAYLLINLNAIHCNVDRPHRIHRVPLKEDNTITLDWLVDYASETVKFEVHLPTGYDWFSIGFSDRGAPYPADYCVLWYDWKRKLHFQDVWTDETGVIASDKQQDCGKFRIKRTKWTTKFAYERRFDTCDVDDYVIEDGTTHVVWSRGVGPLYKLDGMNISTTNASNKGMVRAQLLKNAASDDDDDDLLKDATHFDVLAERVTVPGDETTYWCHVHKLPEKLVDKHHVLRYEAVIQKGNEGLVHHMEVFRCMAPADEQIPAYVGSCFAEDRPVATQVCKRVLAAWAMGAHPFTYPQEAGLPIGGPNFNQYLMLEVHYNNPELRTDFVDSSGIRFHVTDRLRPMDAGVIELGLEYSDKMAIPPQEERFALSGYCVSECTAVSLPPEGITIFGSQLHTHLTGIKVVTRHVRNGRELSEMNRDNHYSTHFQEIRKLKRRVQVLPGDALITTCTYQTLDRTNTTLGGFAITDEMCVNYIHYFPATQLEVCKSAISDQALSTYFEYMNEWENQPTSVHRNGISDNYRSIEWNKMRVELLKEVYAEAPLSMQCNMSSGDRFPGYWENAPSTKVLVPLPPPVRKCSVERN